MKTSYFSFGWGHAHCVGGRTYDKDVIVAITAENPRQIMVDAFSNKWSMEYSSPEEFGFHHYPRGIHQLPGYEMPTFTAEITQFFMPNGRQELQKVNLPVYAEDGYKELIEAGHRLECEMLRTGQISVTVSCGEYDRDIRITKNGPEVHDALCHMLYSRQWKEFKPEEVEDAY